MGFFCASAPPLPSILLYSLDREKPKIPTEAGQTYKSIHLNRIAGFLEALRAFSFFQPSHEIVRTKKMMCSVHSPNPSMNLRGKYNADITLHAG